jgi:hypothetical protein
VQDAGTYTLDPTKYYMNIEVYANSLVQDIMVAGNADTDDAAKEYYPAYKKEDGTQVEAINTLGLDLNPSDNPTGETRTYTVKFNGDDVQSQNGFFSFGDSNNKHSFNTKFTGTYNGITFTILSNSDEPFTLQDYDYIVGALRSIWVNIHDKG